MTTATEHRQRGYTPDPSGWYIAHTDGTSCVVRDRNDAEPEDPDYKDGPIVFEYSTPQDTAFILNACQCHANLLAACEAAQSWLREYIVQLGGDPMDQGMVGVHNQLIAAIAKATAR